MTAGSDRDPAVGLNLDLLNIHTRRERALYRPGHIGLPDLAWLAFHLDDPFAALRRGSPPSRVATLIKRGNLASLVNSAGDDARKIERDAGNLTG